MSHVNNSSYMELIMYENNTKKLIYFKLNNDGTYINQVINLPLNHTDGMLHWNPSQSDIFYLWDKDETNHSVIRIFNSLTLPTLNTLIAESGNRPENTKYIFNDSNGLIFNLTPLGLLNLIYDGNKVINKRITSMQLPYNLFKINNYITGLVYNGRLSTYIQFTSSNIYYGDYFDAISDSNANYFKLIVSDYSGDANEIYFTMLSVGTLYINANYIVAIYKNNYNRIAANVYSSANGNLLINYILPFIEFPTAIQKNFHGTELLISGKLNSTGEYAVYHFRINAVTKKCAVYQ